MTIKSAVMACLFATLSASFGVVAAPTMEELLAASKPSDWRSVDPQNTLYMELATGRVVIELAPEFAPRHTAAVRDLVRAKYFDGLVINRVQDNFVVQWGDPEGKKSLRPKALAGEFMVAATGVPFIALPESDVYAPQTGFASGLPAARDRPDGKVWLTHCYGMVGVARDDDANSGDGTRIYVVIGHAPRQLDRNVTMLGRVLKGMELLSVLPRGAGARGYHESSDQWTPIREIRVAADLPLELRTHLEVLRTDTEMFASLVESRRNRPDVWFKARAGRIDVCNIPIPVRATRPE